MLFNAHGEEIGCTVAGENVLKQGSFYDYAVPHSADFQGQQAWSSVIKAHEDAICVAYGTMRWPDGTPLGAMIGDWGKLCSKKPHSWYFGGVYSSGPQAGQRKHAPYCLWLGNGGDHPYKAVSLNWMAMDASSHLDEEDGPQARPLNGTISTENCETPLFQLHHEPEPPNSNVSAPLSARLGEPKVRGEDVTIEVPAEWLLGREEEQEDGAAAAADNNSEKESRTQKRGTATQRFRHAVVHDDWPSYTARELCEDPTADGPNFVNPDEGLFCKMTTRTLYPVCDATTTTKQNVAVGNVRGDLGCYDIQPAQLVHAPGPHGVVKRSAPYQVIDWKADREEQMRKRDLM